MAPNSVSVRAVAPCERSSEGFGVCLAKRTSEAHLTAQHIRQTNLTFAGGLFLTEKDATHHRPAEVGIDEHGAMALTRKGNGQIERSVSFTFAGHGTGDEENAAGFLLAK
jgi:hypothetical protein